MNERTRSNVGAGAVTFVLLGLILISVTASVQTANWADGLEILTWAALAGLAFGILMAKLPIRGYFAHPLMLLAGVPVIAGLASTLLPDVLLFNEKIIVLSERFYVWISKATLGGVSTDNLMFVVQVAFFAWIMAYIAAWFVYRRRQVWGAVVPTGFAILFNLFYAFPQPPLYFTIFVLASLMLIVRLNLQVMEEWWRRTAVGYSSDIGFDFLTYGAAFSLVFMFIAWSLPTSDPGSSWLSTFEPLQKPWSRVEDQFNRVFGSLRAVARPAESTFFGSSLTMGGPVKLGIKPVMDVQSSAARYFRATTYDKYTGIGWINSHQSTLNIATNDSRLYDQMRDYGRVVITQTYTLYEQDQNILYTQSEPALFDLPVELRYGDPSEQGASGGQMDVAVVRSRKPLRPGESYSIISTESFVDEQTLQNAYTDYSPWIKANYLQLPDTLPERVVTLAQQVTKPYNNPYDKAVAIEQYLRAKIKYNDNVSEPPQGRDGVDYTLFDRPEGYCNYYASAMTVMARAVGIPARVASGYSLGQFRNGTYHIVEANAHSWVEIYFPGYGWIEFEPTASQPAIVRPKKPASSVATDPALDTDVRNPRRFSPKNLDEGDVGTPGQFEFGTPDLTSAQAIGITGGALLALVAATAVVVYRWRRTRQKLLLAPAAAFYERLQAGARWLGLPDQQAATPFERADRLGAALPNARDDILATTKLYVREKFGARPLDESERQALAGAWYHVRHEWRRGVLRRTVNRIVEPPRHFVRNVARAIERWGQG